MDRIKLVLTLMIGILLIGIASAESIGTFKQGDCVKLIQTCADCTYVNISSISYPNSTQAIGQVVMTKDNTFYNYSFCNTNDTGIYKVSGFGDEDGVNSVWAYDFEITPSGILFNVWVLIAFLFVILILFIIAFYKIFNSNSKVEFIIFAVASYFLLLIFVFMSWKVSENYLYNMDWIINLFYIGFIICLVLMFPFIIFLIVYLLFNMFNAKKIKELTDMGYSSEEAKRYR